MRPTRAHDLARVTVNQRREARRAACAWCSCGHLFYGATRLDALDAYTPHVIEARNAALFARAGASA
jgi:hypothetical protein